MQLSVKTAVSAVLSVLHLVILNAADKLPSYLHTCSQSDTCGHVYSTDYLHAVYYSGLRRATKGAFTLHCKQTIEYEYMKQFRAIAEESPLPFENLLYQSHCPKPKHQAPMPVTKNYITVAEKDPSIPVPPRLPANASQTDPANLRILYTMLVHQHPQYVMRLIDAIDEPRLNTFIIHVDIKSDGVHAYLRKNLAGRSNIHVMPNEYRQNLSWGAFSIVNATLSCVNFYYRHAVAVDSEDTEQLFDFVVDLSGTHYPLKSNWFIRETLAQDLNMIWMETYGIPSRPEPHMWHQFVECDGALHRVARMAVIKGINMFLSSQWWALPRHVMEWMLSSSLARDYTHYAKYIIVADENYFSTLLHNSPYCEDSIRRSLLFQIFDKWEHEKNDSSLDTLRAPNSTSAEGQGDTMPIKSEKCLGLDSCGRSPSTLTMEYEYLVTSSRSLFARKFDPLLPESMRLVDLIDQRRGTGTTEYTEEIERWDRNVGEGGQLMMIRAGNQHLLHATSGNLSSALSNNGTSFLHAAEESAGLCMTYMGPTHMYVMMQPCDPTNSFQWFEIGRCSSGYEAQIEDGKCPIIVSTDNETDGNISANPAGDVFCSVIIKHSSKNETEATDTCMDISGENPHAGAALIGYECTGRWNQLFELGNNCTISAIQPEIISRVRGFGDRNVRVCLDSSNEQRVVTSARCMHEEEKEIEVEIEVEYEEISPLKYIDASDAIHVGVDGMASSTGFAALLAQQEAIAEQEKKNLKTSTIIQKRLVREYSAQQQFEFIVAHGTAYSTLMRAQQHSVSVG